MAKNYTNGQLKTTPLKTLTSEEEKHLKTFAEYRHIYEFFQKTGEMVNFYHTIQHELLQAYRGLFDPYYNYSNTCPACVAEFLTLIYRQYLSYGTTTTNTTQKL